MVSVGVEEIVILDQEKQEYTDFYFVVLKQIEVLAVL